MRRAHIWKTAAAVAMLAALTTRASAEDATRPITLDEAVQLALDRNLDITVQRITPRTYDLSLASLDAAFRPVVTSQVGTQSTVNPSTSTLAGASAASGITTSFSTFNAGLTQNLRWGGGAFTATLNNNRQTTTNQTTLFNPAYNTNYSFQITQPLLRGFAIDATRQQIAVTRVNQDISELQLQATITNTLSDVRNAYWDLVYATESVDVARQSVDLATQLVTDNQTRVTVGTMAPIEALQARAQAAAAEQSLVQARAARDRAELALKTLIVSGPSDPNWIAPLDPVDRPTFLAAEIDVNAAIQQALATRTDLARAKKTVEANRITLEYLDNRLLPQVDLVGRYGLIGLGGTQYLRSGTGITGDVLTTIPGSYADALASLFGAKYPTWSLALNVSVPLGRSEAQAAAARGRLQVEQADAQTRRIELQVAADVTNAARTAGSAAESVRAAQVARDLAEQSLGAEQEKFRVGLSTNFTVIQLQRDLSAARTTELQAVLAYRKAVVELDRVQHTTLQTSSVTLVTAS